MGKHIHTDRLLAESMLAGARSRLVNICYFSLLAIGYLVAPVLLLRIRDLGWNFAAYIHVTIVASGTILAFFYQRLPLKIRSLALIAIALCSALGGLATYGIIGSGFYGMAMMAVVVAAIALGQRMGFVTLLISVIIFIIVMIQVVSGTYHFAIDPERYALSTTGWIVALSGYILYCLMLIVGIQAMHALLRELINTRIKDSRDIEQKNRFLESVFDTTHTLLILLDPVLQITRTNKACCSATGNSSEALEGRSFLNVFFTPAEHGHILALFTLDTPSGEGPWLTSSGDAILCRWNASPVRTADGAPLYWVVSAMDITAERRMQLELQQAEKMRSIGQLAGGVAHDFNNMLTAIMGSAELLGRHHHNDEDEQSVRTIVSTCRRAADLTRQLLSFSRIESGPREVLDINTAVRDAVNLYLPGAPSRIRVDMHLHDDLLLIEAEPSHVINAVLNLLINARDAITGEGIISVTTTRREICGDHALGMLSELPPGVYAEISVSDTGAGIRPEDREKIFEPFYTTKERGKGTGLGLSSVYGTIKRHHGAIRLYSEEGTGTTFHLFLPCVEVGIPVPRIAQGYTGTIPPLFIILMEDDASIRHSTEELLSHFGHHVTTAANGRHGVEVLSGLARKPDLIILDWIMPELGGRETLAHIRSIDTDIPIIISSGFAPGHESISARVDNERLFFLQKPYQAEELLAVLGRIWTLRHPA